MRIAFVCGVVMALAASVAEAKPIAPPKELIATIGMSDDAAIGAVAAFADIVKPGIGRGLTGRFLRNRLATMVGAADLRGQDPDGPLYVLVVDDGGGTKGVALLFRITDEKSLALGAGAAFTAARDGWAVVGEQTVVAAVAPFAFGTLAHQHAPPLPTAVLYPPQLLARHAADIEAFRAKLGAQIAAKPSGDSLAPLLARQGAGLSAAIADADVALVTLDASAEACAFDVALVPRAGTQLAKFAALQRPSTFRIADKLPPSAAPMLMIGHLEAGPYRAGVLDAMAQVYGVDDAHSTDALMKASSGEFAFTFELGEHTGSRVTEVFAVADPKAADRAFTESLARMRGDALDTLGIPTTHTPLPTHTYDGVTVRGYHTAYDLSKVSAERRAQKERYAPDDVRDSHMAVFDGIGIITSPGNGDAEIDAARGRGPHFETPRVVEQVLAGARARKESVALAIDFGKFLAGRPTKFAPGSLFVVSLGFSDGNAHLRLTVPAATAQALRSFKP